MAVQHKVRVVMSLCEVFKHYTGHFHHANFSGSKTLRRKRRLLVHRWSWLLLRWFVQMLLLPLLLLALLSSPASAITLPVAMPASHPKYFLTVAGQDSGSKTSTDSSPGLTSNRVPVDVENKVVREDEVMYHFYKNGRLGSSYYRKASTVFMVRLFNDLMRGLTPVRPARKAGARDGQEPGDKEELPFTDTIRSFSAGGTYPSSFSCSGFVGGVPRCVARAPRSKLSQRLCMHRNVFLRWVSVALIILTPARCEQEMNETPTRLGRYNLSQNYFLQ